MGKHFNPKFKDSNKVAARLAGGCPNRCPDCYFGGGRFYMPPEEALLPTVEEVGDSIVQFNDGGDSGVNQDAVIAAAAPYRRVFFCTAIPENLERFPGPVVLTVNRQDENNAVYLLSNPPPNVMFVRVRVSPWETTVQQAVDHYWKEYGIPVVFTFMRYVGPDKIPLEYRSDYIPGKVNVQNAYWCPKPEMIMRIMAEFKAGSARMGGSRHMGCGVRMCGTPWSSMCADCGNCEFLYWQSMRKLKALGNWKPEAIAKAF